jgi:hypothetical protein
MKAIALPLVLTMAAGLAGAAEPAHAAKHKSSAASASKEPATRLEGEVVSTDPGADKLVLKTSSGDETLTVTGKKPEARLKSLHAGERVVVKERNHEVFSISTVKSKHHV